MDFEELLSVWKNQSQDPGMDFDEETIMQNIKARQNKLATAIGWFDWAMMLCLGFMVVMCLRVPVLKGRDFFLLVPAMVCAWGAWFVWSGRKLRLRRAAAYDQSLLGMIDRSISDIESHVNRLRSIQWWCILPLTFTLLIGFWFVDPSKRYLFYFVFGPLFVVCMSFSYWGVHCEIRKKLIPQRDELKTLREQLMS